MFSPHKNAHGFGEQTASIIKSSVLRKDPCQVTLRSAVWADTAALAVQALSAEDESLKSSPFTEKEPSQREDVARPPCSRH